MALFGQFLLMKKMNSKRFIYWVAQFIGWSTYIIIVLLSSYIENPKSINFNLVIDLILFVVFAILISHFQRLFYIKKNWFDLKLIPLLPRVIFVSLSASLIVVLMTVFINPIIHPQKENFKISDIVNASLSVSILFFFWNALYFTFHFFSKARQQEINNLALLASKNEIELQNLKSQLNPHFLFNSLNSIRALIEINPSTAKHGVTQLSNLLRKSLISGKNNLITLEDEVEIVSTYLELEKIRFEERLNYTIDVDRSLLNFKIPPFCIQILVENAIKHGTSKIIDGGCICLKCYEDDNNKIIIKVENSGKLSTSIDLGVGLKNLERRLHLQYEKAFFTIHDDETNGTVIALISIEQL